MNQTLQRGRRCGQNRMLGGQGKNANKEQIQSRRETLEDAGKRGHHGHFRRLPQSIIECFSVTMPLIQSRAGLFVGPSIRHIYQGLEVNYDWIMHTTPAIPGFRLMSIMLHEPSSPSIWFIQHQRFKFKLRKAHLNFLTLGGCGTLSLKPQPSALGLDFLGPCRTRSPCFITITGLLLGASIMQTTDITKPCRQ